MPQSKRLRLNLLSNAYDYLNESLVCLGRARDEGNQNSWKPALLNITFSIELMLKERLRREHTLLLYANIDKFKPFSRDSKTVSWTVLIERLKYVLGNEFITLDAGRLRLAQQLRNQMVHYDVDLEFPHVYHDFANLLNFLTEFYNTFLQEKEDDYLHDHITQNLWKYEDFLEHAFIDELVFYNEIFMPIWLRDEIEAEQKNSTLSIDGKIYQRIHYGSPEESKVFGISDYANRPCGDCGAGKDQIHSAGCDFERCPKCGRQLLGCGCFPDE